MFRDRADAGRQLAAGLLRFKPLQPLVLALPRGGVVTGAEIAHALSGDLDALLVKKLRAPGNPELALGAICEEGRVHLNEDVVRMTGASASYLKAECRERLAEMAVQRDRYRAVRPRAPITRRTVILVDDGLATGATMIAAIQTTVLAGPTNLVVAVPVSPPETIAVIEAMKEVDEVSCLDTPAWFGGVGQFYEDFTQVDDDKVVQILKEFA